MLLLYESVILISKLNAESELFTTSYTAYINRIYKKTVTSYCFSSYSDTSSSFVNCNNSEFLNNQEKGECQEKAVLTPWNIITDSQHKHFK